MKNGTRILALLLSLVMLLSLFPATAFAEGDIPPADDPVEDGVPGVPSDEPEPEEEPDAAPDPVGAIHESPETDQPDDSAGDGVPGGQGDDLNPAEEPDAAPDPVGAIHESPETDQPDDPAGADTPDVPSDEPEPEEDAPVRVVFDCFPGDLALTVWAVSPEDSAPIEPEEDGSYLLLPGEYCYTAEAEGYVTAEKVRFSVEKTEENAIPRVTVELFPNEEFSNVEIFGEEKAESFSGGAVIHEYVDPNGEFVVFSQKDKRWKSYIYRYSGSTTGSTIGDAGCGLLAYTNAIYNLNGVFIEPTYLADYSADHGYHVSGGTISSLFESFATEHGERYCFAYLERATSYSSLRTHLQNGNVAICSVPGHFMSIVKYKNGKYLLLDSNEYRNSPRGTDNGYAWKTEEELRQLPSTNGSSEKGLTNSFHIFRRLAPSTCVLDVNGQLDGNGASNIDGYGTFSMKIDSSTTNNQTDWNQTYNHGVYYELTNIRPNDGYSYDGIYAGLRYGTLTGDMTVVLKFSTINTSGIGNPAKTISFNGNYYRYYPDEVTWYTARQFCEENGGHLVTIRSDEEFQTLKTLIGDQCVWTGGRRVSGTWTWITHENFSESWWISGEPNNSSSDEGGENYLETSSDGWNDNAGCVRHGFIMEIESTELDHSLQADKNLYLVGDPILVRAFSSQKYAWVGLYKTGTPFDAKHWVFWSYISEHCGEAFDITACTGENARPESFTPGDYTLVLFSDNGYSAPDLTFEIKVEEPRASLQVSKTEYVLGESIIVTADSNIDGSWVGLFRKGDIYASSTWIYWYYVNKHPNEAFDLLTCFSYNSRPELFGAGDYSIVLFGTDGYEKPEIIIDIVVLERSSLTTDKNEYTLGEPIYVTARSVETGAWVGLFRKGDLYASSSWIYWYYVNQHPNEAFDLLTCSPDASRPELFGTGEYSIVLFGTEGYEKPEKIIDIVVLERSSLTTDKNEYTLGEPIYVTARSVETGAWVGLFADGDSFSPETWIAWYNVANHQNEAVSLSDCSNVRFDRIVVGSYTVVLFMDDGYENIDRQIEITIAAAEPSEYLTLTVGTVSAEPGKTVELPIVLSENPGIMYLQFALDYDTSRLEAPSFTAGEVLSGGWQFGSRAAWGGGQEVTANGTILTLVFKVKDDAPEGEAWVRIVNASAFNEAEETVGIHSVDGAVTVRTRTPGDATGDGELDGRDAIRIQKYLSGQNVAINLLNADVTGDGEVDGRDFIRLMKYLAGQDVVLN